MTNGRDAKLGPGNRVVLVKLPPGFLDDLPVADQQAINGVAGKPNPLNEYDGNGRAELEFKERNLTIHFTSVRPEFIRSLNDSELAFEALQRLIKKITT
jgi:hypothetical protein